MKTNAAILLHQLQDSGPAQSGSDLARLLEALKISLQNMLHELDTIHDLEIQILSHEQRWLQDSLERISVDVSIDIDFPTTPDMEMTRACTIGNFQTSRKKKLSYSAMRGATEFYPHPAAASMHASAGQEDTKQKRPIRV